MKPYDKITIFRNRHRARDLRMFRELVVTYFERSYDADDLPVDWDGVQSARSEINRMLLRVIPVVHAAGVRGPIDGGTELGATEGDVEILRTIFSGRYDDGSWQEILDVIDLALGVYENSRLSAFARTVNPFHYVITALGFVASLPRRFLLALGFGADRPRAPRIGADDIARLEAVASRLTGAEKLIEARFAEMRDRQAAQFSEMSGQLMDLAERLDFAERVLAQQRPPPRLESPKNGVVTPV